MSSVPEKIVVEARAHGWRIDHYLSRVFSNYSRALLQKAIEQAGVMVNGLPVKASKKLRVNDIVTVRLPELPDRSLPAENIPLNIMFEDEVMVVIDKPPGMIVHPGRGHYYGTLAGALQYHFDQLSNTAGAMRPGIVHRLDRDTSGLLIVAKTNQIHHQLAGQFERREVRKEYRAIVHGVVDRDSDWIETHLRIDPKVRERICVCPPGPEAREAVTFYEVLERFPQHTYVRLLPKTGRTHQLRVHMKHLGHPIVADRIYGGRVPTELVFPEDYVSPIYRHVLKTEAPPPEVSDLALPASTEEPEDWEAIEDQETVTAEQAEPRNILRQALHAHKLEFLHPTRQQSLRFESPLPSDMQCLLDLLRSQKR